MNLSGWIVSIGGNVFINCIFIERVPRGTLNNK